MSAASSFLTVSAMLKTSALTSLLPNWIVILSPTLTLADALAGLSFMNTLPASQASFATVRLFMSLDTFFEQEHGRLPYCSPEEMNDYNVWKNLYNDHINEPEVVELIKRYPENTEEGRRESNNNKRLQRHLGRLKSFYKSEGRMPRATMNPKNERLAYSSMRILIDFYPNEPEVKDLLALKPQISDVLQEGITNLLTFFDANGRLPLDNSKSASKEERRAFSTWRTLKIKYPDHPVTKKLMSKYPYGDTKSGRSIKMLVEFEQKWHRLPTHRSNGAEGEKKVYVRFLYLRKKYADHPAVKEILDRYKDFDPRME